VPFDRRSDSEVIKFKKINPKDLTPRKVGRSMKLQYFKLLRSPGGARKVATGFAIGFGLEMILPITAYIAYLLLPPLVAVTRSSFAASIIGNIIAKCTFLPILLLPIAHRLGRRIFHLSHHAIGAGMHSFSAYLATLLGVTILAILLGGLSFIPVYFLYESNRKRRLNKRKKRILVS
jgi:uncharacterized protein (DUF2062 family)